MSDKPVSKTKKIIIVILCILLAILLSLTGVYFFLTIKGKRQFHKGDTDIVASKSDDLQIDDGVVTFEDIDYVLNENIISVLFIGVDKESINDDEYVGKNGQADALFVSAVDTKTKKIKIIPIKRETMTDVNTFDKNGKSTGEQKEQVCLAYAYGTTAQKSCENVRIAVSRALMGINISNYIAIDLKGVEVMSSAVGGVSLTAIEDVISGSKTIKNGQQVLLKGNDARAYIQSRDESVEGSSKRLLRQKQFLSAFASTAGNQIMNDFSKLTTYYNTSKSYISTDLTFSQITYLVSSCITKDIGGAFEYGSIEGETRLGEKWVEFYPESSSLTKTVLDTFYIKK